ncbi:MAG: ABC transporter permease [Pararhodobacter sp.]
MPVESRTIRSIMALTLREMTTRFGRKPGGYVWAVLQPLFTIVVLAFAWSLLMKTPSLGTSFLLYKATGLLILRAFREIGSVVGKGLSYSKALLFYPGVTWTDALLSRFFLNTVLMIAVIGIILSGIMIYEGIRTVLDWPKVALAVALTLALGFGIGALNCFLFERVPVYQNVWSILTAPLMIISGVIVHYEAMPEIAQRYLWYNPLLHLTGLMRDGFYPLYRPEYISIPYVMVWILIPMFLGLLLVRKHNKDLINR